MRMPVMFSFSSALMRASAVRTLRYAARALVRNITVATAMRGRVVIDTSASSALSRNITTTIPTSIRTSLKRLTST